MTELLTAAQMRAIEKAAIDSGEVTGLELMERAGKGVVEAIFEEWPELAKTDHRAVVLCGPGNNGGDGFVVARLLKEWGWEVEVFLYGHAGKLPSDARVNYERWGEIGEVLPISSHEDRIQWWYKENGPVFIDALFGTGLSKPLNDDLVQILKKLNFHEDSRKRVAIEPIPSGLCSDSGRVLSKKTCEYSDEYETDGVVFSSDLTVTFGKYKRGHTLAFGPDHCGRVTNAEIGLCERKFLPWEMNGDWDGVVEDMNAWSDDYTDRLNKESAQHKYTHGHALILSGGVGKGGAARLAARGALRIGAGVVTVGCPPGALQENAAALDAIMVRSIKGADGLAEALQDERINALCLGPGLGVKRAAELVAVALGRGGVKPRPTVLDADALSILQFDEADGLFGKLHERCVLTPHAGEFARMFPDIAEKLNAPATKGPAYSKVDATREAAARAGCVVLFKGADTVIAAPDGRCSINSAHYERSAPWLATAGSGDVLAGFIAGLLARGFEPMQAAETGAWLHVECALKFGPGLIAEDLPEQLPAVFRDLGV